MSGVDDIIGEWVKKAERTGELKHGRYWGRPFDLDDGLEQTPARLRATYRILKNAGYVPQEIEMLNQLADLREQRAKADQPGERAKLDERLARLEANVRVMLDSVKKGST